MPIDPRLLRVTFDIGGKSRTYENGAIQVEGAKYGTIINGECLVRLTNLSREVSDQLVSETSPYQRQSVQKKIIVEAGRESYGYSTVFIGNIFRSSPGQPPDNITTIRCVSGQFTNNTLVNNSQPGIVSLGTIVESIANELGLTPEFSATDKQISNYTYFGPANFQIKRLNELANIDVFIEDDLFLVVKDSGTPRSSRVRKIAAKNIIGAPELTEQGINVKVFFDNTVRLGDAIEIESNRYPSVNGRYVIHKLGYELANRDTPFYSLIEARYDRTP